MFKAISKIFNVYADVILCNKLHIAIKIKNLTLGPFLSLFTNKNSFFSKWFYPIFSLYLVELHVKFHRNSEHGFVIKLKNILILGFFLTVPSTDFSWNLENFILGSFWQRLAQKTQNKIHTNVFSFIRVFIVSMPTIKNFIARRHKQISWATSPTALAHRLY